MAVPGFQEIMLPLLRLAADGQEHTSSESIQRLGEAFQLSDQDRAELLPSGRQAKFDNRVGWARTHLSKAGLLEATGRGRFCITDAGRQVLHEAPPRIDMTFLKERYPAYRTFLGDPEPAEEHEEDTAARSSAATAYPATDAVQTSWVEPDIASSQTPDELLEAAYEQLSKALAQDLLERVMSMSPAAFENLVIDLLLAMGYGGAEGEVRRSIKGSDEGIDGFVSEDRLGFSIIYVQAKRWADHRKVTRENLQAFVGAIAGQGGSKGVFVTTSAFTSEAQMFARNIKPVRVILIDGSTLTRLMISYNLGVSPKRSFEIKAVDSDYFADE